MQQQLNNQHPQSKKKWYTKWWGILLIIFVYIPIGLTVFVMVFAIANYDETDNSSTQANQQQSADEKAKQQPEDETAAKELTKTLIEGYVPKYCETHQQKRIPLPYKDGDSWKYNVENPKVGVNEDDCRNVITYLVNNVDSSAISLEKISDAKVSVGMNRHELLMSWGVPDDVNSTHTSTGSSDQYVYGNPIYGASYVYLDNDVITAIQN